MISNDNMSMFEDAEARTETCPEHGEYIESGAGCPMCECEDEEKGILMDKKGATTDDFRPGTPLGVSGFVIEQRRVICGKEVLVKGEIGSRGRYVHKWQVRVDGVIKNKGIEIDEEDAKMAVIKNMPGKKREANAGRGKRS